MARLPRIEYPGAIHHVINRGNYRGDVFGTAGAAQVFVRTLEQAAERYGWEVGAYVIMRNHYHLALRTVEPNLARGMHWLQATFATRFNRLRDERGHLFQGRYKSILLENEGVWARVADYIHLNPVRAGLVPLAQLAQFRWSSLTRFCRGGGFAGLQAEAWLATQGLEPTPVGWQRYLDHLADVMATDEGAVERPLSAGWAMGTEAWLAEIASRLKERSAQAPKAEYLVPQDALMRDWEARLQQMLAELPAVVDGAEPGDAVTRACRVRLGARLQQECGASVEWIAQRLGLGKTTSVRVALWRARKMLYVTT